MFEFLEAFSTFERVLFYIAVPFTIITVIQLVMEIVGLGGSDASSAGDTAGTDVHAGVPGIAVFTINNLIYFLTMFGWVGIAVSRMGAGVILAVPIAALAGAATTFLIAYIFFSLSKLTESGNLNMQNALGAQGSVYLTIPGHRKGSGMVQLTVQGLTVEVNAYTDGESLKTGTPVRVMEVIDGNSVVVYRREM